MGIFSKVFGSYSTRELARIEPLKKKVLELDEEYQAKANESMHEVQLMMAVYDMKNTLGK